MNDAEKCTMMEWFVFSRWSEGSSVQSTGGKCLLRLFLYEAFTGIRPLSTDMCTCASTLPLKPRAHSANERWHFFLRRCPVRHAGKDQISSGPKGSTSLSSWAVPSLRRVGRSCYFLNMIDGIKLSALKLLN